MRIRTMLASVILMLACGLMLPAWASAEVVGHITQVEGRVELLKGGNLPATPVALQDKVESGDVLRTKSLSKAQITFIDNSVITLSPQSRLAIDEYVFDPAGQKRNAVLNLFQGMAHVVVNKLFKVAEPDFVIKTHTAVMGVRGTDFGVRLQPNASTILNFEGVTQVGNIFPEVSQQFRRAAKIAFAWGGGAGQWVTLGNMQGTTVGQGLPPTLPFTITGEDQKHFMNQMISGLISRRSGSGSGSSGSSSGTGTGGTGTAATDGSSTGGSGGGSTEFMTNLGGPGSGLDTQVASSGTTSPSVPLVAPAGLTTGTGSLGVTFLNTVTVPPTETPTVTSTATPTATFTVTPTVIPNPGGGSTPTPTPTPTPSTFSFTQQYYAAFLMGSDAPYSQSGLLAYGWGYRTGVYDGYFYATTEGVRTSPGAVTGFYASSSTGTATGTATGTVTGFLGQTLTGTMTYTSTYLGNTIVRTGTVTILPTGELTYNWTDTVSTAGVPKGTGVGTTTQTPGTYFSQTATGQETSSTNLARNQATGGSYGDLTGTRVENGISTAFRAGYSVTVTTLNADTMSPSATRDVSITSQGVLGAPDANGGRVGVMTGTATTATDTSTFGGPVREVPANGSSPAATFTTVIGTSTTPSSTTVGMWAQTADPNAQIITQTYESSAVVTQTSSTTGSLTSTGWGIRTEGGSGSNVTTPTTGGMTGTVIDPGGANFNGTAEPFNHTLAAVVKGSTDRTGPAQGIGFGNDNTAVATTGTVTINAAGVMAHNFTGAWVSPDGRGTITGGTQTLTPGTYFQQTTNSGTGIATLSTPTTTVPYTQDTTLSATMTRTGVAPAPSLGLSGTITSTTSNPAAFPAAGSVPTIVNIQGVVAPGVPVQSGNMTMTTHQSPGAPVSTYTSPVSINTTTNVLNATNLAGRNVAQPGVNRVPARQTGAAVAGGP